MKIISRVFSVFRGQPAIFETGDRKSSLRLILMQLLVIVSFAFLYGLVMGSYHSLLQALVAGIKLVVLFLSAMLICFPSFYIIQLILGSNMNLGQMVRIILSGFVLSATITLSFAPIIVFFLVTGNNYYFLQLLHVAVFIFAGIFGIRQIIESLKYACEKKNIYPKTGVTVFKIWIIILAFVGIQLAWNLRPFLGDRGSDFILFRKYEGNFYTAIIYSVRQLSGGREYPENQIRETVPDTEGITPGNSTNADEASDSLELYNMIGD